MGGITNHRPRRRIAVGYCIGDRTNRPDSNVCIRKRPVFLSFNFSVPSRHVGIVAGLTDCIHSCINLIEGRFRCCDGSFQFWQDWLSAVCSSGIMSKARSMFSAGTRQCLCGLRPLSWDCSPSSWSSCSSGLCSAEHNLARRREQSVFTAGELYSPGLDWVGIALARC